MFPNKLLELKNSGDKFVQSGNFEEAIKCYKEAIDLNPDYSAVWNNMGYVYSKLGKTEEARNCKEKINEIKNG
jgi:tetratricopeptide (TPR) repeat protein